jgi:hypothetical protein
VIAETINGVRKEAKEVTTKAEFLVALLSFSILKDRLFFLTVNRFIQKNSYNMI